MPLQENYSISNLNFCPLIFWVCPVPKIKGWKILIPLGLELGQFEIYNSNRMNDNCKEKLHWIRAVWKYTIQTEWTTIVKRSCIRARLTYRQQCIKQRQQTDCRPLSSIKIGLSVKAGWDNGKFGNIHFRKSTNTFATPSPL